MGGESSQKEKENENKLLAKKQRNLEDKVIFETKDKTGQTVWLAWGKKPNAGYGHILSKHGDDFVAKDGIKKEDLVPHLRHIIEEGEIKKNVLAPDSNGRLGYTRIYCYQKKYYVVGGIGTNGFIVTMFPVAEGENK
jgi:hypothetical protein